MADPLDPPRHITPRKLTEARKLLNAKRAPGRDVWLSSSVSTAGRKPLEVHGPAKGDPLRIVLVGGLPGLDFRSGRITLIACSSWGNACTVYPDADVRIVVQAGCKMTITLADGAKVPELSGDLSRTWWPGKLTGLDHHLAPVPDRV